MNPLPPLIFLGDTHGFIEDFKKQKEIISRFEPELVLCEKLENFSLKSERDYKKILKKKEISNMTSFNEVKELVKFCHNKKIKLIGIDFKNFGLNKNLQGKINRQITLNTNEKREIQFILNKRDKNHIRRIKQCIKKTKKTILVIIGTWHLRENSDLMKTFKNYRMIFPCNKKGEIITEPLGNEEVFYCEKIK